MFREWQVTTKSRCEPSIANPDVPRLETGAAEMEGLGSEATDFAHSTIT